MNPCSGILLYFFCARLAVSFATVIISEVADKGSSDACPEKQEWIELHNNGATATSLAGAKIHDDNGPDDSSAYVFPADVIIESGAFLVLCCQVDSSSPQFKIGGGDTITFRDVDGLVVSSSGMLEDKGVYDLTWAYNEKTNAYQYTSTPTPGRANVFTENWPAVRARLAKQHDDGEAFFESASVAAADRLPPVVELRLTLSAEDWAYQQANASYEVYTPFTGLEITSDDGNQIHASLSAGGRMRPRGQSTLAFPLCLGSKTIPFLIDVAGGACVALSCNCVMGAEIWVLICNGIHIPYTLL